VKRWGAILQSVLLTLLVASVVVLALRVARLEAALRQIDPRSSPLVAELKPGMALPGLQAVAADGAEGRVDLSGRKLLFVYSSSCPYSRQMFPVWAAMGERAGQARAVYLSVDDPAAPNRAVSSTPENGFTVPRESPPGTASGDGFILARNEPLRRHFSRVPQTIVVAGGRVVSVDIGVLPPDAVERVLNTLNNSLDPGR
jgi:hypothetical protein